MAGASGRYGIKSKNSNPFFDDDELEDVDDDLFLKKAPNKSSSAFSLGASSGYKYSNLSGEKGGGSTTKDDVSNELFGSFSPDDRRQELLLKKKQIEQQTLESSQRAIGVLHETEHIGISTAEELVRQREQLERTGARLDEMNSTLRSSEKHIQNIKSVFSSIKNYFSKPSEPNLMGTKPDTTSPPTKSTSSSQLEKVLDQNNPSRNQYSQHPGLRTRGIGDDFDHKPLKSDVDEQLDENLGIMSQSLSRLKGLAQGLGSEIDDQNQLLDRLQTSADKADWRIQRQNKDMERLLKK